MAILGFERKYVKESVYDADVLKLKKDEIARVSFIDKNIVVVFRHFVQMPSDPDNKQKNNGYYRCLGRNDVLFGTAANGFADGKGEDPEHCEFCKRGAFKSAVATASRGFATHVLRYYTDTKGTVIQSPGGGVPASVIVCKFGEKVHGRITDILEQNGNIPAGRLDLKVSCESEKYQNWTIDPYMPDRCIWINAGEGYQQYVAGMFEQARMKEAELEMLLANTVSADRAHQLCEMALNSAQVLPAGITAPPPIADTSQLADLISGGAKPSEAVRGVTPPAAPATAFSVPAAPAGTAVQTNGGFVAPPANFKPPSATEVGFGHTAVPAAPAATAPAAATPVAPAAPAAATPAAPEVRKQSFAELLNM